MIVSNDIHPHRELYYIGAIILDTINEFDTQDMDYLEVFVKVNEAEKVSMNLYSLALDWLFVLGAIDADAGKIKKCL